MITCECGRCKRLQAAIRCMCQDVNCAVERLRGRVAREFLKGLFFDATYQEIQHDLDDIQDTLEKTLVCIE